MKTVRVFIYRPHGLHDPSPDDARCRVSVSHGRGLLRQCGNKACVSRHLVKPAVHKTGRYGFCKTHDPEAVAERLKAKERGWATDKQRSGLRMDISDLERSIVSHVLASQWAQSSPKLGKLASRLRAKQEKLKVLGG